MDNKEINYYVCVVIVNFIVHLDYEYVSKVFFLVSLFYKESYYCYEILPALVYLHMHVYMYASFEIIEGQLGDENIKKI